MILGTVVLAVLLVTVFYIGKLCVWIVRKDIEVQKERARKVRVKNIGALRAQIKNDRRNARKKKLREMRLENW
jgi:Na+/pantothenate symporter